MTPVKRLLAFVASLATSFLLLSCGGSQGSPADYPKDFKVTAGDGSVTASWTVEPGVQYWIFYGVGPDITTTNWVNRNGRAIPNAVTPAIITGLANGTVYSFTINGRTNNGPGGSGAPTQAVTPIQAGENWKPDPPLGTKRLSGIAFGTGVLGYAAAVVGKDGIIFSSVAGGDFAERTNPQAPVDLNGVAYGLYGFVGFGPNGTIIHSLDGVTWTSRTSNTTSTLFGGTASSSTYLLTGANGVLATSSDATSWNTQNSGTTNELYASAFGANQYVAVGAAGTIVYSSDATNWAVGPVATNNALRGVSFGLLASADGLTTTNVFVAVGDNGTVLRSPDGVTWAVVTPFTTANLLAVTNGGRFVAVGAGGVIFTSSDGLTWETRNSGTTADLTSVARTVNGYTAVGDNGVSVSTF
jgi:hypothetical protein